MYEFDRETLLDLLVNAIPLAMILFFVLVFAVLNPFGSNPVNTVIQFSIMIVTFLALAVLTYYSGKAIQESERDLEAAPAEYAEPQAAAASAETDAAFEGAFGDVTDGSGESGGPDTAPERPALEDSDRQDGDAGTEQ